jgi:DNA-binding beta-propeller fold protein YncE
MSAVFVGAIGCNAGGLDDPRHQTGSQTMVASSDYRALYVANVDHGTVSRVDPAGSVIEFQAGLEPTRIARAGDRVFVTLRGERAVAVFNENGTELELETKIEVGAEPFGVVANEKGDRIYVASSLSYRVDEIDAEGLTILRSFPIDAEPRWLALHPSEKVLYVGSPYSRDLLWLDLDDGTLHAAPLPSQQAFTTFTNDGTPTGGVPLTPRITGDMAVSPRGYEVAVPGLYADNNTPIDDTIPPPPQGYYGGVTGVAGGGGRLTPVLMVIPTANDGQPLADYGFALLLTGRDFNGYPASATFDPEGKVVFTPIEAGEGVIAVSLTSGSAEDDNAVDKFFTGEQSSFGFATNPIQAIGNTGAGPRSVVFLEEDRAFSHAFIDNKVADIKARSVIDTLGDATALFGGTSFQATASALSATGAVLPPDIAAGRRLYYSSTDQRISGPFTGLSCSTCHFDGRNDGLTWTFSKGLRQTPSLAGNISVTNPVRWEGDRETVQIDAMRTAKDAMGGGATGDDLTQLDLDNIAAFVDWTRDVDRAADMLDAEAVARGKAIFERPDVACSTCHNGPRYTNNEFYTMLGMSRVKTRPLVGIAATAPYFHDGSAATLMDVLLRARDGSMGNTSALSDPELHDLEQYLRSL